MVIRGLAVITGLTILAAGCDSAGPVYVYSKPGVTLEQLTRDEGECGKGAGGGQASAAQHRRCMSDRGYAAQELQSGSGDYLELRRMPTPVQNP